MVLSNNTWRTLCTSCCGRLFQKGVCADAEAKESRSGRLQSAEEELDVLKAPKQLAILRADGGYAKNKNWKNYREDEGISFEGSAPYCQFQNGVAERTIGVLKARTRAMMDFSCNPPSDWGYCFQWAAYLKNNTTSKALPDGFSPNLMWEQSTKPLGDTNARYPIFGCLVLAKRYVHGKAEVQAVESTFLGHSTEYKAFIVRQLGENRRIFVARGCRSVNDVLPYRAKVFRNLKFAHAVPAPDVGEDIMQPRITIAELRTFDAAKEVLGNHNEAVECQVEKELGHTDHDQDEKFAQETSIHEENISHAQGFSGEIVDGESRLPVLGSPDSAEVEARGVEDVSSAVEDIASTPARRGTRIRVPSRKVRENHSTDEELPQILNIQSSTKPILNPKNDEEALNGPYAQNWMNADRDEINHMLSRNLWEVVPKSAVPAGKRILGCRFERTVKWKVENPTEVDKFKSRLVAQGYNMKMGIDFSKKFAKVVRMESVMLILAVLNHYDLNHNSYDIKAFFLHGESEEDVS